MEMITRMGVAVLAVLAMTTFGTGVSRQLVSQKYDGVVAARSTGASRSSPSCESGDGICEEHAGLGEGPNIVRGSER